MNKLLIISRLCYTQLVYDRINIKLNKRLSKLEIEQMVLASIENASESEIHKIGKNYYIYNFDVNLRVTVNSYTFRVITVDIIDKNQ